VCGNVRGFVWEGRADDDVTQTRELLASANQPNMSRASTAIPSDCACWQHGNNWY